MKKYKISSVIYVVMFVVLIGITGLISSFKLIRFYVNDEVVNNEYTEEMGSKFDVDIASNFCKQFEFVNLNGAFHRLLGHREMNDVVKLNNGHLLQPIGYAEDEVLEGYADRVGGLNEYLKERGTDLLYVMTPHQVCPYHNQLPAGIQDYGNSDIDRMLEYVSARGVDTIDIRERMHDDNIDQCNMIYATDHHWTTEAGFYAYGIYEDYIMEKTGCTVDPKISDESQYTIKKYEKWHLGSWGHSTGKYFTGIDDFDLYIPDFETSITSDEGKTGSLQDMSYDYTLLQKRDITSKYVYDDVLEPACRHYVNNNCDNDIKVLMVGDSFSRTVYPFLTIGFKEVQFVWNYDTKYMTLDYIEEYDPDVVIIQYYPAFGIKPFAYEFQIPEDLE